MSIDQKEADRQVCSGMYSRKSWGGNMDPFILTKFIKPKDLKGKDDPMVSLVIFEWQDKDLIGQPGKEDGSRVYICDQESKEAGMCQKLGSFILAANATEVSKSQVISEAIHLNDPPAVNYPVKQTGYYCVGTFAYSDFQYDGVVEFRNAFGELPAAQIAKLPFYAAITIIYAFAAIAWGALYWLNRSDILAVQNYITAILVFLVVEMFMTWLFYDYQNRHGLNAGAKALLVIVSILSAARNSFSFFLLLIVCMGYGVVKPTLGKTMNYIRGLAIAHFVFGVIYAVASLSVTPENAGPLVLLVVLPLAATLTAFYIWTLNSLNLTTKDLVERKQTIKAAMYRKLWYCILVSIVVIFVFFFVNSWIFAGQSDEDFVPNHWKSRWFILDGWLNLVYFFDVAFVAYVWRPTANNRRFAMSDEIAQDDDGFEIASIRDSMDLDSDLEANGVKAAPAYDPPRSSINRDVSPLPAPIPQKPMPMPRESMDGETIFALGDEDRDSDDSDDEERRGLTGG
ncbi:Membrane protein ptm1 [Vermiconidia calcicola]|uniref:Membrane protein ptm1 n=1 Tax=Vermiconidia calcicola TaxID=1690605 RepID=A0ACC3NAZ8_9PEZI|nr:Membrane protein ptm1 [Vermiconidia calcicola]